MSTTSRRASRRTHIPKLSRRRNRPPKRRRRTRSIHKRWERTFYARLRR